MILPGLLPLVFYKRRPSRWQIALGLLASLLLSAALGYWQDEGTSRVWLNTLVAAIGGGLLYGAILAYLMYRYQPRRASAESDAATRPTP